MTHCRVQSGRRAALLLCAITFLVVTGTLSTASGKFPGSSGDTRVRRIGAFEPAVALHVKAVATFGVVFLLLAAWALRNRLRSPWLVRGCAGLLAILLVQMAVGETQYRTYGTVPWWLVLIHVILAATLFAWTVGARRQALAAARSKRHLEFDNVRAERRVQAGAPPADSRGCIPRLERRRPGCDARGRLPRKAVGCGAVRRDRAGERSTTSRPRGRRSRSKTG